MFSYISKYSRDFFIYKVKQLCMRVREYHTTRTTVTRACERKAVC